MLRLCSRAPHRLLSFELAFEVNLDLLAGLHGYCEGDALESGDEVEGAFFWYGFEALGVGADGEGAVWFCDSDGLGVGLGYSLG